jgi:hypothetical protein
MEKNIIAPGIVVYKNAIPVEWNIPERLEESLDSGHETIHWRGSRVGFYESVLSHRNCQDFIYNLDTLGLAIPESEDLINIYNQIRSSIDKCLEDYCKMYDVAIRWVGHFNMVKYGPGEKFNVHSDDGDPYRCTVSAVGYPNDNYDGGELWFDKFDIKIKPEAGDFILCPSSFIYSHASLPVESGIKYAVVIMTDRSEFAHRNDSPVYYPVEERSKYGLS